MLDGQKGQFGTNLMLVESHQCFINGSRKLSPLSYVYQSYRRIGKAKVILMNLTLHEMNIVNFAVKCLHSGFN